MFDYFGEVLFSISFGPNSNWIRYVPLSGQKMNMIKNRASIGKFINIARSFIKYETLLA